GYSALSGWWWVGVCCSRGWGTNTEVQMIWVIWLQLTMTMVASAGQPVASPTVHRQQLPGQYATRPACEEALALQRQAYGPGSMTESGGVSMVTKAELWCAREGAQR